MTFVHEWLWIFVAAAGAASFVAAIFHKVFNLRGYDASYRGFNAPGCFTYIALILWCVVALAFCYQSIVLGWFNVPVRLAMGCVITIVVCHFFYGLVHLIYIPGRNEKNAKTL